MSTPTLAALVRDPSATPATIAAHLDALDFAACKAEAFSLDRAGQRALYEKMAGLPLDIAHFVPDAVPAVTEVIHHGKNTLPLPSTFRFFEKRFARPGDGSRRLFGYNEGASRPLIGPGCFVLIETAGRDAAWVERGPLVVDYFQVPDGAVPAGWPRVVPNSSGLQFFVYNKTRDYMRPVSQRVSIGAAYKVEKALDHYFILVREG